MARLLSVNVGLPSDISWQGRTVQTAVRKEPVQGRRMVRRLNIDGDGQGDLEGHGGEYGFITGDDRGRVFFNADSVYGTERARAGSRGSFSSFPGTPHPRAHPVVVLRR